MHLTQLDCAPAPNEKARKIPRAMCLSVVHKAPPSSGGAGESSPTICLPVTVGTKVGAAGRTYLWKTIPLAKIQQIYDTHKSVAHKYIRRYTPPTETTKSVTF